MSAYQKYVEKIQNVVWRLFIDLEFDSQKLPNSLCNITQPENMIMILWIFLNVVAIIYLKKSQLVGKNSHGDVLVVE